MERVRLWTFTTAISWVSQAVTFRNRLRYARRGSALEDVTALQVERYTLRDGTSELDTCFVQPTLRSPRAALLICHGIGETVDYWRGVQQLLAMDGIASLVFNYSGFGRSPGKITQQQCEADARTAFAHLQSRLPEVPVSVLGYSLGSGVATALASELAVQHLILCASFASLREGAHSAGVPELLTGLLPDIWCNREMLGHLSTPVLIVHGEADPLFPASMARELAESCASPCELVVVPGATHSSPFYPPDAAYWSHVARRM